MSTAVATAPKAPRKRSISFSEEHLEKIITTDVVVKQLAEDFHTFQEKESISHDKIDRQLSGIVSKLDDLTTDKQHDHEMKLESSKGNKALWGGIIGSLLVALGAIVVAIIG